MKRPHGGNFGLLSSRGTSPILGVGNSVRSGPGISLYDFSASLNPLGPPDEVLSYVRDRAGDIERYGDMEGRHLRKAIAGFHGVPVESVALGAGSAELIYRIARLFRGRPVTVLCPTFTEYEDAAAGEHCHVQSLIAGEASQFRWDTSAVGTSLNGSGEGVVFACNPNNPTGALLSREEMMRLAGLCEERRYSLAVDEVFMDFVRDALRFSMIPYAAQSKRCVVLRSFTKFYSMPGLRVGYAVGHPSTVASLLALQPPWVVGHLAVHAAAIALRQGGYADQSRRFIAEARRSFEKELAALPGITPFKSEANFILCRWSGEGLSLGEICGRLAAQNIFVRPCDSFTGLEAGRYCRVAVRKKSDNEILVQALREVVRHEG